MINHFNKLLPSELERLAILSEECAETIQIVNKIIRHGYVSSNPYAEVPLTNRELLESEIGHIIAAMRAMVLANDLSMASIEDSAQEKKNTIGKWQHHQKSPTIPIVSI